jgi:uncharacterized membrane protein
VVDQDTCPIGPVDSAADLTITNQMEIAMLPNPLHPAIVHFPVVLAVLLPIFAFGALWAIRRGARPLRAWGVPLTIAGALLFSTWAAVQTGESQEDVVEKVVAYAPLDTHEEAAETFITAAAIMLVVMAGGLAPGRIGKSVRAVATVGTVGLVAGAAWVGHTGGQLVYQHGAASAYAQPATPPTGFSMGAVSNPGSVNVNYDDNR